MIRNAILNNSTVNHTNYHHNFEFLHALYVPPVMVTETINNIQAEEKFRLDVDYDEAGNEWYQVCTLMSGYWLPVKLEWLPFEQAWEEYTNQVAKFMEK